MNDKQLRAAALAARLERLNTTLRFDAFDICAAILETRLGARTVSDEELLAALRDYEMESPRSFYTPEFINAGFPIPPRARPLKPRKGKPRQPLRGSLKRA